MNARTRQGSGGWTAVSWALAVCVGAAGCTSVESEPAPGGPPGIGAAVPQGAEPAPQRVQAPATVHENGPALPGPAAAVPGVPIESSFASSPAVPAGPPNASAAVSAPGATSPARSAVPARPLPAPRAVLREVAPGQYLATFDSDDPAGCGACVCPDEGCSCRLLRSGECLCTFVEGGDDCRCDCGDLPTTTQEDNVGSTSAPVWGPGPEAP